jgi:cell division septum initiation protein DivIVA
MLTGGSVNRAEITRSDFPSGSDGYDRPSVDAHLDAVAALTEALEARIRALEVERDAFRLQADAGVAGSDPEVETDAGRRAEEVGRPDRDDDEVSARLVATRLALEGVEREEILRKLEATYNLPDTGALIDDVLARVS